MAQWDIEFVPVKNCEETEKRFVIVASVSSCSGGVFTKEPESYYVENGKVKKMCSVKRQKYKDLLNRGRASLKTMKKEVRKRKATMFLCQLNGGWSFLDEQRSSSSANDPSGSDHQKASNRIKQGSAQTDNTPAEFMPHEASVHSDFVNNESPVSKNKNGKDFEGNLQEHAERAESLCDTALQRLNDIDDIDDCQLLGRISIAFAALYLKRGSKDLASNLNIAEAENMIKRAEKCIRNLEHILLPLIRNIYCLLSLAKSELHSILAKRCANKAANLIGEDESKRDWKGRYIKTDKLEIVQIG